MGRKTWVSAGIVDQVEVNHCLGDDTVPFLGGKVGVARGESSAKMILECADHTFGSVVAVGIRGNKLEVNIVIVELFLHGMGALVVEDVEIGGSTVLLEVFMARLPV